MTTRTNLQCVVLYALSLYRLQIYSILWYTDRQQGRAHLQMSQTSLSIEMPSIGQGTSSSVTENSLTDAAPAKGVASDNVHVITHQLQVMEFKKTDDNLT